MCSLKQRVVFVNIHVQVDGVMRSDSDETRLEAPGRRVDALLIGQRAFRTQAPRTHEAALTPPPTVSVALGPRFDRLFRAPERAQYGVLKSLYALHKRTSPRPRSIGLSNPSAVLTAAQLSDLLRLVRHSV